VSVRATVRALPTLARVGFAEAVAYRAEMFVWILATTMSLIMMALWTAVAREAPVGRFGQKDFIVYFLVTFIVRQLTGAWAAWEINYEVRQGTLALRLLRPIHPLWHYAVNNIAALPLRLVIAIPVAVILLAWMGRQGLAHDPLLWLLCVVSVFNAWLITFLVNIIVGSLSLFMESSLKLQDVSFALFMVMSGYFIPVELFPPWLRTVGDWLWFRYQIGLSVELATGAYGVSHGLVMLARQLAFVLGLGIVSTWLWHRGLRRFAAYGG
jgi:ABC-2 type transport system permease protein